MCVGERRGARTGTRPLASLTVLLALAALVASAALPSKLVWVPREEWAVTFDPPTAPHSVRRLLEDAGTGDKVFRVIGFATGHEGPGEAPVPGCRDLALHERKGAGARARRPRRRAEVAHRCH